MTDGADGRDRESSWIAIDLETTGLDPITDRIIEIGAVRCDAASGNELSRFERLINPQRAVSAGARAVHGISDAELAPAPVASAVLPDWLDWLATSPWRGLIAHNARFDASFLARELGRNGLTAPVGCLVYDTLALARAQRPGLRSYRLDALASTLGLHPGPSRRHRALADSLSVMRLWQALDGASHARVAYPIAFRDDVVTPPSGWDPLSMAIELRHRIRMQYAGGTRGSEPREMEPLRYVHMGGVAYVVGRCGMDGQEKRFRLDRIVWYERIVTDVVRPSRS